MPVLDATQRGQVNAAFQQDATHYAEQFPGVTKTDILAAVNAADDWVVNNQASYNGALPLAVRTNFTGAQKARLLAYVLRRRYEVGA